MNLANTAECNLRELPATGYFEMFTSFGFKETFSIAKTALKDSSAVCFVKLAAIELTLGQHGGQGCRPSEQWKIDPALKGNIKEVMLKLMRNQLMFKMWTACYSALNNVNNNT